MSRKHSKDSQRKCILLAVFAALMLAVALAPDLSGGFLARDLSEATPDSINRALRHLDGETRLDSDDRLIPFLAHNDSRTRQRVLRHISRLNSSQTSVAILEAARAGTIDWDDAVEAIERIRNPLQKRSLDAWIEQHDADGSVAAALEEHLARLDAEVTRWGAPPAVRALIDAQLRALPEQTP